MDTPQEAMKSVPRCLTEPVRFRIPKEDFELLREFAYSNGYSIANLSKSVLKSWIAAKIKKPMREAERQQVAELFPDVD